MWETFFYRVQISAWPVMGVWSLSKDECRATWLRTPSRASSGNHVCILEVSSVCTYVPLASSPILAYNNGSLDEGTVGGLFSYFDEFSKFSSINKY